LQLQPVACASFLKGRGAADANKVLGPHDLRLGSSDAGTSGLEAPQVDVERPSPANEAPEAAKLAKTGGPNRHARERAGRKAGLLRTRVLWVHAGTGPPDCLWGIEEGMLRRRLAAWIATNGWRP